MLAFVMITIAVITVTVYACCVAAGRADEASEEFLAKIKAEENSEE
jgi:hypothetical protein